MAESTSSSSPNKKRKHDDVDADFQNFTVCNILNENVQSKTLFVEGRFDGSDDPAVVLLEKTPFDKHTIENMLAKTNLTTVMHNDIYGVYTGLPPPDSNGIKTTIIHPATKRHLMKYTEQQSYLITESAKDYQEVTLPFIKSQPFSIEWVYNILSKKSEADRIVFEDSDGENGFILLPDMKWDVSQVGNLYIIAICHRKGILSIRDLTDQHLPLLKNIQKKGTEVICKKFGLQAEKLQVYFHYQPSYYHLHVHFCHLNFDAPGRHLAKAHLLQDVIDNIEMKSDYYQNKSISFTVREKDPLFLKFKEAGKV
ncbi:m7GpppX diphosphatase-like [Glandiceps talaboti]